MTESIPTITWNPEVKLILSDLDETIADLYEPATPEMVAELTKVLDSGLPLFIITGQGKDSIQERVINRLPKSLRWRILMGHCNGVEVWGINQNGELRPSPFYSVYEETFTTAQKPQWRKIINQVIAEFKLTTVPTMPVSQFKEKYGSDPLVVMFEDRGPQITFEFVNAFDLPAQTAEALEVDIPETHGAYDLRIPVLERADELLREADLPVTPRIAGVFALDFVVEGVSKTTAVQKVLSDESLLKTIGLTLADVNSPEKLEIWGDKFSGIRGGGDRYMSLAVDPTVRSLDFREENPAEFEVGYNIQLWDGKHHLHKGLLEYLQSR
jgi:hydroxymethylpyrimidine pyrophosphatase-like HAD family hydrolase